MKTVFIRAIEANVDEKAIVLRNAIHMHNEASGTTRFEVDPTTFGIIPKSPFAYWTSDLVRNAFFTFPAFSSEKRTAKQGLATADDFRFVRLATEVMPATHAQRWFPFAKGGKFSRFYSDVYLKVDWENCGARIKSNLNDAGNVRSNVWMLKETEAHFFFRPGLTWPLRTNGLSFRIMPSGCIFAHKGPAAFVTGDNPNELLVLCALVNSRAFATLVAAQLARTELAQSFEVGLILQTPIPDLAPREYQTLNLLAHRSWLLKRDLDTCAESSHAFTLPALLKVDGATLINRAEAWQGRVADVEAELEELQAEVDNRCFDLYAIDEAERARIDQGFGKNKDEATSSVDDDSDETEDEEIEVESMAASLLSWSVGAAFGRFDVRLATGSRAQPAEPKPFDPLPVCSPGMLTGEEGLPLATAPEGYPFTFPTEGVLVDDPGHPQDLMARVRVVFEAIFDEQADERLLEAESYLGDHNEDLRAWFAKRFFAIHLKRYSRSRRKAPIYWQLGTPSGSYSVWCYCHRFSTDTLFRLNRDYVAPKVDHEERKINELRQETGKDASTKQRRAIAAQESFVEELRAFKAEVARIAPLWNPNLNDGVIINFAPLWRLVPQQKPWQKECKKVWDKLCKGDYDWAHLAMHLWPERVVPKCQDDRSLAISHGIEDDFWYEDDDGKWHKRKVDADKVQELISERASTAVKSALNDLLAAPTPDGARKASKGRSKA